MERRKGAQQQADGASAKSGSGETQDQEANRGMLDLRNEDRLASNSRRRCKRGNPNTKQVRKHGIVLRAMAIRAAIKIDQENSGIGRVSRRGRSSTIHDRVQIPAVLPCLGAIT
ncbi:MAG: hypothetical protein KGM49_07775 [Sphingomonadales bacterium]|nr:hypothetical protein [Sphingomonadales bacterium]